VIDLDHNATTAPTPEVCDAVDRAMRELTANPSSVHRAGQRARAAIELARQSIATLLGAKPRDIVLTSGGTESINLAVRGALAASDRNALVTSRIEHAAVRELAESLERDGTEVRWAPLDDQGRVDAAGIAELIDDGVALVSIQAANNETGAIQPFEVIGGLCRERGVPFHTDAVQLVGKAPVDLGAAPIDLASVSFHKLHGPKGVGALYVRQGTRIRPLLVGAQELGRRAGTENTPAIVGAGVCADEARAIVADPTRAERIAALRDLLESLVTGAVSGAAVNAASAPRLANTTSIAFDRLEAEAMLMLLSERGVLASAGAACSSGSLDPSPVLLAMGIPERLAHGSIRFSLGRDTTERQIREAAGVIAECAQRLVASGV